MSLTTPYLESYLTANGVDITFGFSFDAISENYVRCLVYMPDGAVITPNFTVDVAAGEVSIVSMTTPDGELLQVPPEGATVRIYREAPESQDATASVLQAFTSKQLEKSLDKIVATVQQVDYKATHKTVRTTETERDVWLDKLTDEHNDELLKWDESGHKITTSGLTEQEIRNTTAQATTIADEAKAIATEARTTANEAKSTSNDAKAIAQNAATDAANAVQTATNATDIANAADAKAESAKTTATNASTKADAAVSTANSALQKANTAMVQSSDALADAAVSLENSEQAIATANEAKNTADGIDGKATSALTNSEQAVATANAAKNTADSASAKATAAESTANTALDAVAGKQDKLIAGDNIIISGNVISATGGGGGSGADNNGLEGDYCSKYGIVDETASGLPTQGTGNQIIIPAQLVMDVPGVSGLTTNASAITHDLVSTTNCEIFLSEGTVIEATDVFFQTDEPENGATGYAAWWNGTEWKFKSSDTGNVWRAANAVRIAKCIFTDGALTRLCFTGCRVLDKQEW